MSMGPLKYMTEVVIRDVCKAYSDWGAMLLRYFNPVGAHPSARIGEDPLGEPSNLMPYVAQVTLSCTNFFNVHFFISPRLEWVGGRCCLCTGGTGTPWTALGAGTTST